MVKFTKERSKSLIMLLLFAGFCLSGVRVLAQSETATLSGVVIDEHNDMVAGARITMVNQNTGARREAVTNEQGYFVIPSLAPSTYTVTVEQQGFAPIELRELVLNVNDQRALRIQLKIGGASEQVVVNASEELNSTTSASVGTVVDRQFVENIPLNGRSFQSLISLTPGVVIIPSATNATGQFSVDGQRAESNAFSVDGVSANIGSSPLAQPGAQTSGNLPGLTTFGTTQSLVSVDALQEFKVQTSSYAAEYGRQPGGQISIATRSGTNEYHGSAFEYFRNDALDANDFFANQAGQPRPPLRQNDFGGTFGGPIRLPGYDGRDRTFFFFSYEGLRLRQPQFLLTNVPTLALRQDAPAALQPILNAFPVPNGRDLGNGLAEFSAAFSNPSSLNAAALRIDHTIGKKMTIFGRYNYAPSQSNQRGLTGVLSDIETERIGTQTFTSGLTVTPTASITSDLRFNFSNTDALLGFAQDTFGGAIQLDTNLIIPSQYNSGTAQGAVGFHFPLVTALRAPSLDVIGDKFLNRQRQINIVENLSYVKGSHQLKFGFDFRRLTPVVKSNSYLDDALFDSEQEVLSGVAPIGYVIAISDAKPIYLNYSAYAQDTWKASPRLTFDIGVRWDVNPGPGEATGNYLLAVTQVKDLATMQLQPRGSSLWSTTYNNFAPRFGVAYQLFDRKGLQTVARGGFGVFYDTGNNMGSQGFYGYPSQVFNLISNVSFPLSASQLSPPTITSLTPPYGFMYAFDPSLKLPYTLQWNVAVEQSLGRSQTLTVSYVGASGRRLLQQREIDLSTINPDFTAIALTTNNASSDYDALQVQFQRRLSNGLQALVSYTWSHALDDDSASYTGYLPQRGNAGFDIRHVFAAAVTYDIPKPSAGAFLTALGRSWSVDATVHAQSGSPVDLMASTFVDPATGNYVDVRPNEVPGVPLYVDDPSVPGGRRFNSAAFTIPAPGQQGNFGRNVLRGFGLWQVDMAVRRQLKVTEKLGLQIRAEAFNLFNHSNFGAIQTLLTAANFGQATSLLNQQLAGMSALYQIGGPRSMQLALKLLF